MLNHSDTTLWVATAVLIVVVSFLAGYVFVLAQKPREVECSVVIKNGVSETHEWVTKCRV